MRAKINPDISLHADRAYLHARTSQFAVGCDRSDAHMTLATRDMLRQMHPFYTNATSYDVLVANRRRAR